MPAAPGSPVSRDAAVAALMKSKGLNTLDDLENDDGADFLYELQPHHNLVVIVEMCQAQRPSKLGSLKGSHAKYEEEFSRLEATMSTLAGNGSVELIKWEPGMPNVPSSSSAPPLGVTVLGGAGRRSRPQSAGTAGPRSRPQSAAPSLPGGFARAYMGGGMSEPRLAPRIGAFEVCYKLVNTQSGQQYGPVEVFSKIGCGHWPGAPNIIIKRVQEQLQAFLQKDLGAGMIYQHVRDATRTHARSSPILCIFFFSSRLLLTVSLSLSLPPTLRRRKDRWTPSRRRGSTKATR